MATHSSILAWRIPRTEAWRVRDYGVSKSRTQLKRHSTVKLRYEMMIVVLTKKVLYRMEGKYSHPESQWCNYTVCFLRTADFLSIKILSTDDCPFLCHTHQDTWLKPSMASISSVQSQTFSPICSTRGILFFRNISQCWVLLNSRKRIFTSNHNPTCYNLNPFLLFFPQWKWRKNLFIELKLKALLQLK